MQSFRMTFIKKKNLTATLNFLDKVLPFLKLHQYRYYSLKKVLYGFFVYMTILFLIQIALYLKTLLSCFV